MILLDQRKTNYVIIALLVVLTCIAYWHLGSNNFIDFDDNDYITKNFVVQRGLTLEGIKYAFAFHDIGYWHPLTWMSLMLDYQLFGISPTGYHVENLVLHIISAVLLFLILNRLTGKQWQSAFASMLFAIHPINVESIAWAVERKTVLSGLFFFLSMWFYLLYIEKRNFKRYLLVFVMMAVGLMAKSMIVILPAILLLLDYWPLRRFDFKLDQWKSAYWLLLEKLPLFALSFASTFITMQSVGMRVVGENIYSFDLRVQNALISTMAYIGKLIWPTKLIIYYPLKASFPLWQVTASVAVLITVTVLSLIWYKKHPWLFTGWFWYLVAFLPISGLVQSGLWPAMADRFAHLPLIGLYIMIAWGVPALVSHIPHHKILLSSSAVLVTIMLVMLTSVQAAYWKDTVTLFEHAFSSADLINMQMKYPLPEPMMNYVNSANKGMELANQGKTREAINYLSDALVNAPRDSKVHNNLAVVYERVGNSSQALYHYNESLRYKPSALIHTNTGILLAKNGRVDEAIPHFREAVKIDPKYVDALINLGGVVAMKGRFEEGMEYLNKALKIDPNNVTAKTNIDNIQGALKEKAANKLNPVKETSSK
ncbi:MAG: tetratricopeptide repeat protein [Desulfuromonadales bacterium]